jgi:mannose-6-phosphate isomerase-like protein (cupin superfamily)
MRDKPRGVVAMSIENILEESKQHMIKGVIRQLVDPVRGAGDSTIFESAFDSGGHFPPHMHDHDQTLIVLDGEGILFIGEEPHTIGTDSVIRIPAQTPHCLYNTGFAKLRLLSVFATNEPALTFVDGLFPASRPLPDEVEQTEELAAVA